MEKLKDLLGENLYKEVITALGEDKKYFFGEGDFVPIGRFNEVNEKCKALQLSVNKREEQLSTLAGISKDNEELSTKIKQLQADNAKTSAEYNERIASMRRENAIAETLRKSRAKNFKAVNALLDHSRINVAEDGSIVGLDDQLEKLKTSDAYLFENPQITTSKNVIPPASMGLEEVEKYFFKNNPGIKKGK